MRWRALRYVISGGSAAVTHLLVYFLLTAYLRLWYIWSAAFAFLAAVSVSFLMQKYFTFGNLDKQEINQQTALFLAVQILNLGVNALLLYIAVDWFKFHYFSSQIIVLGIVATYSFFIYQKIFKS